MNPVLLLLHCAHNMEYNRKSSTLENLCRSAVLGWPSYIDMSWVVVHAAGKRHGQRVGEIHEKFLNIAWYDTRVMSDGTFGVRLQQHHNCTYDGLRYQSWWQHRTVRSEQFRWQLLVELHSRRCILELLPFYSGRWVLVVCNILWRSLRQ